MLSFFQAPDVLLQIRTSDFIAEPQSSVQNYYLLCDIVVIWKIRYLVSKGSVSRCQSSVNLQIKLTRESQSASLLFDSVDFLVDNREGLGNLDELFVLEILYDRKRELRLNLLHLSDKSFGFVFRTITKDRFRIDAECRLPVKNSATTLYP